MNHITSSRVGYARPSVAVLGGLILSAIALALSALAATPALGGTTTPTQEARAAGYEPQAANQRSMPRVVREWASAWNAGSPERMAGLFTEDGVYEDHAFQVVFQGRDGVAQWVSITSEAIDDTHVEIHGAFRRGDRIAVQWTFSGTDSASGLGGQPPTGNSFSVPATSIFEMKGNKIRRVDDYYNLADLLRQIMPPADA